MFSDAHKRAVKARDLAWDGSFPVDPIAIGEQLLVTCPAEDGEEKDCEIQFVGLSDKELNGDSGYAELKTDRDSGRKFFVCAYNKDEAPVRQRFTQAHELGHVLLRHVTSAKDKKMRDLNFQPGSNPIESDANHFAAELLMPAKYMEVLTQKYPDILVLARKLGVSTSALRYRLRNLKLL